MYDGEGEQDVQDCRDAGARHEFAGLVSCRGGDAVQALKMP